MSVYIYVIIYIIVIYIIITYIYNLGVLSVTPFNLHGSQIHVAHSFPNGHACRGIPPMNQFIG